MWKTVFVFPHTEVRLEQLFPPFTENGKLMLWDKDRFPHKYQIKTVIFDIYSTPPVQYVHLTELIDV